jgi:hypothetical protein
MAVATNSYFEPDELAAYMKDPEYNANDQTAYISVCEAGCRAVDAWCGRGFYLDADVSPRAYVAPRYPVRFLVDDFATTTGLLVATDEDATGTFETSWTITTDFRVFPVNQIGHTGETVAYYELVPTGQRSWPYSTYGLPTIQVTAKWGWPSVPPAVKRAAFILAANLDALRGGPVTVDGNAMVQRLLQPYRRGDRVFGAA